MAKEESITMEGVVTESFPGAQFLVELTNGHKLRAVINGRMRKNNIRVFIGDAVEVEVSPYDVNLGRISFRQR